MAEDHTGGCLCGAIRYRVTGGLTPVIQCHCAMCRRWHGHVGAYTGAARGSFRLVGPAEPAWYESSPGIRRGFCPRCGASLFWDRSSSAEIDIAAGTLDDPTGLSTAKHIFTADKGDYYTIADGAPQHLQRSGS